MKFIGKTPRRSGFTMLELMLAMSVAAMLALSLYAAMRLALRARNSATAAGEATRALSIATEIVRRDLESVPPPTESGLPGPFYGEHQQGSGIAGDNDSMQFYTIGRDENAEESPLSDGVRQVEYLVRTDVNPPALVRRVTRNLLPVMAVEDDDEEEVICRNVRSFSVRYYDGTTWQESWDSTAVGNVLPMSVGITLEQDDPANPDGPPRRQVLAIELPCAKPADATMLGVPG